MREKAGFCHYHKYELTVRQMRLHGCLKKKGAWCKRFEPNLNHQMWSVRMEKGKSKNELKRFMKKGKKDDQCEGNIDGMAEEHGMDEGLCQREERSVIVDYRRYREQEGLQGQHLAEDNHPLRV